MDGHGESNRCYDLRHKGVNVHVPGFGKVSDLFQVPERWAPYRFDTYGSSHQIMHIAVILAAYIHFGGLVHAFHAVRTFGSSCFDHELD